MSYDLIETMRDVRPAGITDKMEAEAVVSLAVARQMTGKPVLLGAKELSVMLVVADSKEA